MGWSVRYAYRVLCVSRTLFRMSLAMVSITHAPTHIAQLFVYNIQFLLYCFDSLLSEHIFYLQTCCHNLLIYLLHGAESFLIS